MRKRCIDTWDYIYDHADKLIKVEKNSETIGEYVYDGDGKRIQVTENGETKTYIYSGLNVLYEENTTGTATYVYDISSGVCRRYSETRNSHDEQKPEWTAYDKNGERITDSDEIENLMNGSEADQARAVYLMLLMTHPEIEGDPLQMGDSLAGGYLFWIEIEEEWVPIWITISGDWEAPNGDFAGTQIIDFVTEGNPTPLSFDGESMIKGIQLVVYQGAFQSIAHFFHVVGHEGCHVYDLIITGGRISSYELEFNGYMWNFNHRYGPFLYPFKLDNLFSIINYYMAGFSGHAVPV